MFSFYDPLRISLRFLRGTSFQSLGIRLFMSANFKGEEIYSGGIPVFFLVNRDKRALQKKLPHSYDEVMEVLNQ